MCGEPTWVPKSSGQETARHKKCLASFEHGTRVAYRQRGCRCADCRAWNAANFNQYRVARRDVGRPLPKRYVWIKASTRALVYERDGWTCQLCFEPIDRAADSNSNWAASVDHIVPRSHGGGHSIDNLRTAHRWCNCVRADGTTHSDLFA